MTFETSKNLSGVGAVLLIFGFIPYTFLPILSLIGIILLLIGLHGLAGYYKESSIFSNFLYGVILSIIGGVVSFLIALFLILPTLLSKIFPSWTYGNWAALSTITPNIPSSSQQVLSMLYSVAGAITAVVVILFFTVVISAFLLRKSLNHLSDKSKVGLFATTGTLLVIGAILTIIAIGYLLIWIAMILLAIAFFSLKPLPPPREYAGVTTQPQTPPTSPTPV